MPKKQRIYNYFYKFASEALHIVIFENFIKSMTSCLSKLKVTRSFCFTFKIPDDRTASIYIFSKFFFIGDQSTHWPISRENSHVFSLPHWTWSQYFRTQLETVPQTLVGKSNFVFERYGNYQNDQASGLEVKNHRYILISVRLWNFKDGGS